MTALCQPPSLRRPVVSLRPPASPEPERPRSALRVGLLGGSFNPAHDGHLHVSLEALKRRRPDQVWCLASPQLPLTAARGMAPLAERLAGAQAVVRHPRLKVMALETRLGTRYTADTLARLTAWPGYRFVWLMGADNLAQLPRWWRWHGILAGCPVAVFDRHPYSHAALAGPVARAFACDRLAEDRADALPTHPPPAWVFVRIRPHPASATAIRAERWAAAG